MPASNAAGPEILTPPFLRFKPIARFSAGEHFANRTQADGGGRPLELVDAGARAPRAEPCKGISRVQ